MSKFLDAIEPYEKALKPYLGDQRHLILREDYGHVAEAKRAQRAVKSAIEVYRGDVDARVADPKAVDGFELLANHVKSQVALYEGIRRDEDFIAKQRAVADGPELGRENGPFYRKGQRISTKSSSGWETGASGLSVGKIMKGLALGTGGDPILVKAMSEGTNSAGGFTVPVNTMPAFLDKLRDKMVLNAAGATTVLLQSNKTNMAAVLNDPTPGWRAEGAIVSESDAVFGQITFAPKSLAVLVKVSRELLADSLNIEQILETTLAGALALQLDYAGLYGTGLDNQPLGLKSVLTTASRNQVLATNGAKLSAQGFYLPIHTAAKKVAEGNDAASAVVLSPRTYFDIQGFTDTTNQPLRPSAFIENNLAFYDTNSVPNDLTTGSSNVTSEIFTGNFSNLLLGLRQEMEIQVLSEAYAGNLQVGFLAHLRADWQVARSNSFWLTQGILPEV